MKIYVFPKEKRCFLHASKEDRRGPVGDVRLARAAECIECIAAADYVCFAQSAALQLRCCAPLRDEAMMAGMAMPGYHGHPGQCGYPVQ